MKPLVVFLFLLLPLCFGEKDQWVIQLSGNPNPQLFALENNIEYLNPVPHLPGYYLFKTLENTDHYTLQTQLAASPQVQWSERQIPRKRFTRKLLMGRYGDPFYASQWHLHDHPYSVQANEAWKQGYYGNGITVAVVDDGVQIRHPDLKGNINTNISWDFNGHNKKDPTPNSHDSHGTSCAGVVAAVRNNGHCGSGAAPYASIVGLRLISGPVSDYTESLALSHHRDVVDIYTCSWGPSDDGQRLEAPGHLMKKTLEDGVKHGRNGKGNIFTWAGGNGKSQADNCNYDGYASSRFTIAIGALDYDGKQSWYSEPCAALMGVTPSSGSGRGITTTDLTGNQGHSRGECTNSFGGTSSAAPLAAGVLAMVLESRPELTWRDVQHIIAKGATPVDEGLLTDSWTQNSRGYKHSHSYGFGLLVAPTLISVAKKHKLVPKEQKVHSEELFNVKKAIPNGGGTHGRLLTIPITITGSGIQFVEHVELEVQIKHPRRGEIGIRLQSPEQITSILSERRKDSHSNEHWTYTSVKHWGEQNADGVWNIEFEDLVPHNSYAGHVKKLKLSVYGY